MSSPSEYNGGAVIAMAGKNCVAIGSDMRLGAQFQTIEANFEKGFFLGDTCAILLPGLATDVQTLSKTFRFHANLFKLRENREMNVDMAANMVASMLYKKRFGPWFVEPIIAGLAADGSARVYGCDLIGAVEENHQFLVGGTASEELVGMCETFWKPDMDADQLFETASQCLLSALDRDCYSGWGGIVHVITPEKIITRRLKTRMD